MEEYRSGETEGEGKNLLCFKDISRVSEDNNHNYEL